MNYDILVVGDEREGIARAISAAQDGRRVAVIASSESVPSLELMRRAANNIAERREITISLWRTEVVRLVRLQKLADQAELECLGIDLISGQARFVSMESVEVSNGDERQIVSGAEIILACGTKSWQPKSLRTDGRFIFNRETMLNLNDLPRTMIVVGAGETGLSSAMMFAAMGVEVVVVDEHVSMMEICEMFGSSADMAQSLNIAFRLGDEVIGTELRPNLQSAVRLASGRVLVADAILICVGREGKTQELNLEVAGVGVDEHGRVWCDASGRTWVSRITAVGDVIGFPRTLTRLASGFQQSATSVFNQTSLLIEF